MPVLNYFPGIVEKMSLITLTADLLLRLVRGGNRAGGEVAVPAWVEAVSDTLAGWPSAATAA